MGDIEATTERKGIAFTRRQCGAKLRGRDAVCRSGAMANGRCRIHGGTTPAGAASPHYIHGRRCESVNTWKVPHHLRQRFGEALTAPDIFSLRRQIAAVDCLIQEQWDMMGRGESPGAWRELRKAFRALKRAARLGDKAGFAEAVRRMDWIVKGGTAGDRKHWGELFKCFRLQARMSLQETRRVALAERAVPVDQLVMFATLLMTAVRAHVKDRKALAGIVQSVHQILGGAVNFAETPRAVLKVSGRVQDVAG